MKPIITYLILLIASFSYSMTSSADVRVLDDGTDPAAFEASLQTHAVILNLYAELTVVAGSKAQADSWYTGCYKNPAGDGLAHLQKQFYCMIPFKFRSCYTLKLLSDGKTNKEVALENFKYCEQKTGFNYTDSIENFNNVLNNVFFASADEVASLPFSNNAIVPQVDPEQSFVGSLLNIASVEVRSGEAATCIKALEAAGKDTSVCTNM